MIFGFLVSVVVFYVPYIYIIHKIGRHIYLWAQYAYIMEYKRVCTTVDKVLLAWAKEHKIKIAELIRQGQKHLSICDNHASKIEKLTVKIGELAGENHRLLGRVNKIQQENWAILPKKGV